MAEPPSIAAIQAEFSRRFHIDLPAEFKADGLTGGTDGLILSNEPGRLNTVLMGHGREQLMKELPVGHHTVGFWGYGSNSYAFYFVSKQARELVYLRLHTGGAYTDPVRAAADITDFVPPFVRLLRSVRERGGRLLAIESLGTAWYLYQNDGLGRQLRVPLLGCSGCIDSFDRLLNGEPTPVGSSGSFDEEAAREGALKVAKRLYADEVKRPGKERVGMRAIGAAMNVIRGTSGNRSTREFHQLLLSALGALRERHQDLDGENEHAQRCIGCLIDAIRQEQAPG